MKNKKGQSLIEIVFSIGIVVLVLTGVAVLVVSTAKISRISAERKKAVELSQQLIENKVLEIKNDPLSFWKAGTVHLSDMDNDGSVVNKTYVGYFYDIEYKDCGSETCNIVFTVKWGEAQKLQVERLFSKAEI